MRFTNSWQYCAKEMQAKFAEISEITRISAIKMRTFVLDKMRRNFGASIVLMSAKFRKVMNRNEISRHETEFRVIRTKFHFHETKYRFDETKFRLPERNFVFQEFVADYRIQL